MRITSRRGALAAVMLALVAWVTADVLLGGPLVHLDHLTYRWIARHVHGEPRVVLRAMSYAGQRIVAVVPLGVAAILLAWRRRSWRPVLVSLLACVGLTVAVDGIKTLVGRTAPSSGGDVVFAGGNEYPSGHAVNGVVLWALTLALVAALGGRLGRWTTPRRRGGLVALAALAAGIGMVGLNFHWLTDVLAGWSLGLLVWSLIPPMAGRAEPKPAGVQAPPRAGRRVPSG